MRFRTLCLVITSLFLTTAASAKDDVYVVKHQDAAKVPMAAWADGTNVRSAMGKDAARKAPKKAVTYTAQSAKWPTGTVTVLTFKKSTGGVLHPINDETAIYVLQGSAQADVNGAQVSLKAGDVATTPRGALRSAGPAEDTMIITWNAASLVKSPAPTVVRGLDVAEAKMPPEAPKLILKRYDYPGNSIRVARLIAGGQTSKNSAKTDSLIYLTSGHMKFHQADQVIDVFAGDFIREIAGLEHYWEPVEDSSFVTTSGIPANAAGIDAKNATDIPK